MVLLGVNNAYVYFASLVPFGISLVLALFFVGFNGYVLGAVHFISYILTRCDLVGVLIGVNALLVLILLQYLQDRKLLKNKVKFYIYIAYALSQVLFMALNMCGVEDVMATIVAFVLGLLFLYVCLVFVDATINKCLLGKINTDEKICGGTILIVFSMGIAGIGFPYLHIGFMCASVIILTITRVNSCGVGLVIGATIGIGFSLYYMSPLYISLFCVLALASSAFRGKYRIFSALALLFSYIIFSLLFNTGVSCGEVVGIAVSCLVFCIIPSSLFRAITIVGESKQIALANIFNRTKSQLVSRVGELSKVFDEMTRVYRSMVKGNMTSADAVVMLKEELVTGVCSKCSNYESCFRSSAFMDNCLDTLISVGYEKNKILLIDIPEFVSINCIKINHLIQYANDLIRAYIEYRDSINNIDSSRLLIADQLSGVSVLLDSLSQEVGVEVSFNNKYEKVLKENLAYAGIVCAECVVCEKRGGDYSISLIVKNNEDYDRKIEKIVSKVFKCKFVIEETKDCEMVGSVNIVLKSQSKYGIVFGGAVATKTGCNVPGDSYSFVDVGNGKYIASICDGMGSGKGANELSCLTISLIEKFYRAGFENDIILNSVNKLLSLTEDEKFSTIDLCMVDGKKGVYDFIKLGASSGYIKHANGEVEVISSSGLPIGVLEDICPHITKKTIRPMDIVVLMSDGVSDVLGEEALRFIRTLDTINPQSLADDILSLALDMNGGVALDDMTVLCVRVFENG